MRVLFIGPFPWPSPQGSQAYLASQARALVRRGHTVTIATYGSGTGGDIPGVRLVRSRTVPGGSFADGGLHPSRPLHDLALARTVRRLCRHDRPDVLHAHNVEGPLVAWLARSGLPIVFDLHTTMRDELASHLPRPLKRLGPWVGRAIDRAALRSATHGCAISPSAAQALQDGGLACTVVGPAVDVDELVTRPAHPLALPEGAKVLYLGNLDTYQDLPLLYDAMHEVPATLVVATSSTAPVPGHVHALRMRDFRDGLDAAARCQLAVIPRRVCAGFPIKLLNLLGMGCPVVMMDSVSLDLPGVVTCTPATLASSLRALLTNPHREALGLQGREAILSEYSLDAMGERLEALYRRAGV